MQNIFESKLILSKTFFSEEAESLGVQELPRSSSSLSMRTDASGHGEHVSSDSFYDSDNTEAEATPAPQSATKQAPAGILQCIAVDFFPLFASESIAFIYGLYLSRRR